MKADKKMKVVTLNLSSITNLGKKNPQNNQEKNPKFPVLEQHSCRTTCDGSGEVAASMTQRYPDKSGRKGKSRKIEALRSQS